MEHDQHMHPGDCPFSLSPEPQTHLSSYYSSGLCPPSVGAQGEQLRMKFCVLALSLANSCLPLVAVIPVDSQVL